MLCHFVIRVHTERDLGALVPVTVKTCSIYSMTAELLCLLHYIISDEHAIVSAFHSTAEIKILLLSIVEVSSCKASGCTGRLSNRCFVEKRKKRNIS